MSGFMMRGGCLMPVAMAEAYDRNRAVDVQRVKDMIPEALVSTSDGYVTLEMADAEGNSWYFQGTRSDMSWSYGT